MERSPRTRTNRPQPKPKPEPKDNSGQNPRETDGNAGNDSGKPRTGTNEQARQPKPKPNSTTAAQAKDPKATESKRETIQEAEHEQQRTNKQGNPNRSPTQPQQLRSKTQKPRRASGKQSRQERTRTKENKGVLTTPGAAAVTSTRVKVGRSGDWQTTQTE